MKSFFGISNSKYYNQLTTFKISSFLNLNLKFEIVKKTLLRALHIGTGSMPIKFGGPTSKTVKALGFAVLNFEILKITFSLTTATNGEIEV